MEFRERRIGQIVRDFMQAYTLAERLGEALRGGELRSPAGASTSRLISAT